MDGLDILKRSGGSAEIGEIAPGPFSLLRCGVRYIRKGAECRDVAEITVVELPHVNRSDAVRLKMGDNVLRGLGEAEGDCHIVRGPEGDIPDFGALLKGYGHNAVHNLVQRAVAAGADNALEVSAVFLGEESGVAPLLGDENAYGYAALGKRFNRVEKVIFDLAFSGDRIDNEHRIR